MSISRRELRNRPIFVALPPFSSSHDDELWGIGLSDPDEKSPDSSDDRFENNGDVTDKQADVNNEDDFAQRTQRIPTVVTAVESEAARVHAQLLTTHKPGQRRGAARREQEQQKGEESLILPPRSHIANNFPGTTTKNPQRPPTSDVVVEVEGGYLHKSVPGQNSGHQRDRAARRDPYSPDKDIVKAPEANKQHDNKAIPAPPARSHVTNMEELFATRLHWNLSQWREESELKRPVARRGNRAPRTQRDGSSSNRTQARLSSPVSKTIPSSRATSSSTAVPSYLPRRGLPSTSGNIPQPLSDIASSSFAPSRVCDSSSSITIDKSNPTRNISFANQTPLNRRTHSRQPLNLISPGSTLCLGVAPSVAETASRLSRGRPKMPDQVAIRQDQLREFQRESAVIGAEDACQLRDTRLREIPHGCTADVQRQPLEDSKVMRRALEGVADNFPCPATNRLLHRSNAFYPIASMQHSQVSSEMAMVGREVHVQEEPGSIAEYDYQSSDPYHGLQEVSDMRPVTRITLRRPSTSQQPAHHHTSTTTTTVKPYQAYVEDADSYMDSELDTAAFEQQFVSDKVALRTPETHKHATEVERQSTTGAKRIHGRPEGREARVRIEEIHTEEVRPAETSTQVDTETSHTVKANTGESRTELNPINPAHTEETRTAYHTLNIAPGEYPWNQGIVTRPTTEPERRFVWLRKSSACTEYPTPNMTPDCAPWNRPSAAYSTTEPERRFIWLRKHPNRTQDIPAKEVGRKDTRTEEVNIEQAHAEVARTKDACAEETCAQEVGTEEAHAGVKDAYAEDARNMDARSVDTCTEHSRTEKDHVKELFTREAHTNKAHTKGACTGVPTSKKTTLSRPAFMLFALVISLLALGSSVLCAIILDTLGGVA
jgi:hypothetical protein